MRVGNKPKRLQAGGTLNPRQHIYVSRDTDDVLFELLCRGEYANVLTSRQMGKSSLMMHTVHRLDARGIRWSTVDLAAELGSPTDIDTYYLGLLSKIARDLRLTLDLLAWWQEQSSETNNQRLMRFFRDVVFQTISVPVVIFFDEIDSTLKLPYTDDLFTALRGMYNERGMVETYRRLTFCLVGVATPNELIKDLRTTAYNVGTTLELRDFGELDDLSAISSTLNVDAGVADRLLKRVVHWTGGHPYLTQRLCTEVLARKLKDPHELDQLIELSFGSLDKASADVHFQQILRFLTERLTEEATCLSLYSKLLKGKTVRDQPTLAHAELKLSGLVKRDEEGYLRIRNPIYERLFGRAWLKSMPSSRTAAMYRGLVGGLSATMAVTIIVGAYFFIGDDEQLLQRGLTAREFVFGLEHPNTIGSLNNLATYYQSRGQYEKAEPLLKRGLEASERALGKEHPSTIAIINALALLFSDQGKYNEAEPLMRRALAIEEKAYGPDHPNVALRLNNLAQLLQGTNRLNEAEPLMRRALTIDEKAYGPDHPKVSRDLNNLALLLQATNRLNEAEPLMRRALAIDEKAYGPDHPNVALGLNNLALLLQGTNRLNEAEPLMRRALAIDERAYDPDDPVVSRDLNNLVQLLQATSRFAEAEPLIRRALAIDEKSLGPEHPNVARDLNNLAHLLEATNRLAEAEPLYRRALAIDEKSFGPEHPNVARDLDLSMSSRRVGPPRRAVVGKEPAPSFNLKKTVFIREPVELTWTYNGKGHPDVYEIEDADDKDFQSPHCCWRRVGNILTVTPNATETEKWWRVRARVDGEVTRASKPVKTTFYKDVYDRIKQTGILRVTATSNQSRGIFKFLKGADADAAGVDVELAEQIARQLSVEMKKEIKKELVPITTWEDKLFEQLGNGETDVVIDAATKLKYREEKYNIKFSGTYFCAGYSVVYKKVQNLEHNKDNLSVRDLIKGKTIAYSRGTASAALIDKLAKEMGEQSFKTVPFDEIEAPIQYILNNSNVQFALTDTTFAVARVFEQNEKTPGTLDSRQFLDPDFPSESTAEERRNEYAVAVYQDEKKLLDSINTTIRDLKNNGTLQKMLKAAAEDYRMEKFPKIAQEESTLLYTSDCSLTAAAQ
jgi:tetratricopeptide (TPR) repeat protein/ABC-type amino acid transport substrate-binding protein